MQHHESTSGLGIDMRRMVTFQPDRRQLNLANGTMSTNYSKKYPISHVTSVDRSDSDLKSTGHPLRHFYLRSTVGFLGPTVVLFYFIAIWRVYLAPLDTSNPVVFGAPGGTLVYYSWFIAGVIGLNLSTYGLAGVEAAMLMEPRWNVKDAMRLMIHANVTWSGPGGWMKTFKWIIQTQKPPGRLWFLLALPSVLVFIAWPLSGLCLETTSGYLHGTRGIGSRVIGFSYANFNERTSVDAFNGAMVTWQNALDARIPGAGIVYTPRGFDRSQHPYLDKIPVILPKDDGVNRLFSTAQAETPIEGSAWGILLQYNCSIVDSVSQLSLLRDRKTTSGLGFLNSTRGLENYYVQRNTSKIFIQNQTDPFSSLEANSMHAVAEMAHQVWPDVNTARKYLSNHPNASYTTNTNCYYNKDDTQETLGDYPGIEQERIFEIVLWQLLANVSYGSGAPPIYNHTLDRNLTDLYGAYEYGDFMYGFKNRTIQRQPMSAIGIQCRSSSSVGTADIDGVRSSYSNFVRTDTPINVPQARCAARFGSNVLSNMILKSVSSPDPRNDWVNRLFTSVAAPPQFYAGYTDDPNSRDTEVGYNVRLQYLQASQLRQSMLRAFSAYAVQLMYNGGQGFTTREGSEVSVINPNATSFITGTVIKQGTMPVIYPLVLFALWALVSTSLCATYGFRKRWTEILDGHTLFRLGADLDEEERRMIQKFSNVSEVETSFGLAEIPGLVGDAEPKSVVGRIGLVRTSAAVKEKLYR